MPKRGGVDGGLPRRQKPRLPAHLNVVAVLCGRKLPFQSARFAGDGGFDDLLDSSDFAADRPN
jgi:hypothetical protein